MGRDSPRYLPTQSLVEITARTVGRRYLLLPSAALTRRILGALGRTLALVPVELHAFAFMSNHWHALISAPHALACSRFVQHVHAKVTAAVRQIHGWEGKVFGKSSQAVVAPDCEDDRLRYILSQGAKEGLVASPRDWPGAHCARALAGLETLQGVWIDSQQAWSILRGGTRSVGRTPLPAEIATVYPIELQPLPSWAGLELAARQARVWNMVREIEESAAEQHPVPLGRYRVLAKHPMDQPERSTKRRRAPRIHTRDEATRNVFDQARAMFVNEHRNASLDLRAQRLTQLPALCFPPTMPFQLEGGVVWPRNAASMEIPAAGAGSEGESAGSKCR
jgi:REP element-mobilizing transposase RayT